MSESCATIFAAVVSGAVGLATIIVIWWQAYLLKRQIALTTFLDLDKEWNSESMTKIRSDVRSAGGGWNTSRLEGVLEFFEKVGMLKATKALTDKAIFESTLVWYLARYFLFARGEIRRLRDEVWKDDIYTDIEDMYDRFVDKEASGAHITREAWEQRCKETEAAFWDGERQE